MRAAGKRAATIWHLNTLAYAQRAAQLPNSLDARPPRRAPRAHPGLWDAGRLAGCERRWPVKGVTKK